MTTRRRPRKYREGSGVIGMVELEKRFLAAQAAARSLSAKPDNETLLELYSWYKQATEGDASGARPGAFKLPGSRHVRRLGGA